MQVSNTNTLRKYHKLSRFLVDFKGQAFKASENNWVEAKHTLGGMVFQKPQVVTEKTHFQDSTRWHNLVNRTGQPFPCLIS